jgi:methyl-accepting chemotaxis protein
VGEAARRAEEIFEGADIQTMDVQRMVGSMDEIAKVASRNAHSIDGVTATSGGQAGAMDQMVESTRSLTDLADRMHSLLRRFDTGRRSKEAS